MTGDRGYGIGIPTLGRSVLGCSDSVKPFCPFEYTQVVTIFFDHDDFSRSTRLVRFGTAPNLNSDVFSYYLII